MTQKHGREHEHDLNNSLNQATTNGVWATTVGYSGNAASDNSDIVVTVDPQWELQDYGTQFNIEAKKITRGTDGNRVTVFRGSSGGETGLDELHRLFAASPEWGHSVVTMKFSRKRLVVVDVRGLLAATGDMKWPVSDVVEMLEPRATPSDNVSVVAPTLDNWDSARASPSDGAVLAQELGLPLRDDTTETSTTDTSTEATSTGDD